MNKANQSKGNNEYSMFNNNNKQINYVQIQNNKNENNCYINVLIHTFSHLTSVSNGLIKLNESNVFKYHKLLQVFVQLLVQYKQIKEGCNAISYHNELVLNPISFKNELNTYFKGKKEFQLNEKGDPTELLLFIINAFHSCHVDPHSKNLNENEKICKTQCISHKEFYIKLIENTMCTKCNKTSSTKYDDNYFIYEIYVEEAFKYINDNKLKYNKICHQLFTLSKHASQRALIYCDKCKDNTIKKQLHCESIGSSFIVNCIISRVFTMENICYLYFLISRIIKVGDIFQINSDKKNKMYMLIGMTLYFGSHYLCVFYEHENECFVLYDDTKNKEFETWEMLIEYLIKNKYYPVLLFYQEKNGSNNDKIKDKNFNVNESMFIKEMKLCKEMDKGNESHLYLDSNIKKGNDDVWECEYCKAVNKYDRYKCRACNLQNKTMKMLIDSQLEVDREQKKLKESINSNYNNIWLCQSCLNENKYDSCSCNRCGYVNENVKDMIEQSQMHMERSNKSSNYDEYGNSQKKMNDNNNNKTQNSSRHKRKQSTGSNSTNISNASSSVSTTTTHYKKENEIKNVEPDNRIEQPFNDEDIIKALSDNEWLCPLCKRISQTSEYVCINCRSVNEDLLQKEEYYKSQSEITKHTKSVSTINTRSNTINKDNKYMCISCHKKAVRAHNYKCLDCQAKEEQSRQNFFIDSISSGSHINDEPQQHIPKSISKKASIHKKK